MGNILKTLIGVLACTSLLTACTTGQERETTEPTNTPEAISTSIHSAEATTSEVDRPGGSCPQAEAIDTSTPESLAEGFLSVAMCWDSVYDRSLTAAAIRAKSLMTPALAEVQVEPERNSAQALFNEVYDHRAYAVPRAELAASEINSYQSDQHASRVYRVLWDWEGRDGTTVEGGSYLLTLHMAKDGDTWLVEDYSMDDFSETRK